MEIDIEKNNGDIRSLIPQYKDRGRKMLENPVIEKLLEYSRA